MKLAMRLLFLSVTLALVCSAGAAERALPFEPLVPKRQVGPTPVRVPVLVSAVDPARLNLRSSSLLVLDQSKSEVLVARNAEAVRPIASITKLMTAMVVLDARLRMDQVLSIANADIDTLKGTHSRLQIGTQLSRRELLRLALMASENRAAAALARTYPGGFGAFVKAMNRKAQALAMTRTHFVDSTGLSQNNVSSARDLARMVTAAHGYPLICEFTTTASHVVQVRKGAAPLVFRNSNRLLQTQSKEWHIGMSKTGYTSEAGRCLVMHAKIGRRPVIVVLLNSWGKLTPIGDANRIRRWVETHTKHGRETRVADQAH